MGLLSGIAGGLDLFNQGQAATETRKLGQDSFDAAQLLGDKAVEQSKFRPFTTTSASGTIGSTEDGSLNLQLSPEQQALQQSLTSQAGNMFAKATGDTAEREQTIFDRLESIQNPGRERDRLALEERLFNQGREGVATSMFGGTPEGLAMAKAIEESRGQNAINAMDFGQKEQLQQANIGTGFLNASTTGENQLMKMLQGQTGISDIVNVSDRQGAELAATLGATGMQEQGQMNETAAGLSQAQMQAVAKMLGQAGTNQESGVGFLQSLLGAINL
jgi:hypothetical protein